MSVVPEHSHPRVEDVVKGTPSWRSLSDDLAERRQPGDVHSKRLVEPHVERV